ncbi:hypothetical protein [Pseudomonas proteolytica]|uniref:hypothetical protein n=1 Tax=Pseudomonas proteolytica TaxID=219574 RepID=UPI001473E80A|nr:hypothetical protein [Pseudomonas proteolytica]NMZ43132.1 hypothetical protein [Pseudomonas proteolytica]
MNIDEDTCEWLGCPTPLEMHKHHCSLLEDEISTLYHQLRKARANVHGLVQLSDDLATGKAQAEESLRKALEEIARLQEETTVLGTKVRSLSLVSSQCDYLFRENQRLLQERNQERLP